MSGQSIFVVTSNIPLKIQKKYNPKWGYTKI